MLSKFTIPTFGDTRLPPRFWAKVVILDNGCWEWAGSQHRQGYGFFRFRGHPVLAHRVAYEQLVDAIPANLECDHLCRNCTCVNPVHLELVTHRENTLRGNGTLWNRSKTHCPQGHPYSGVNLYVQPDGRRACRTCKRDRRTR